MAHAGAPFWECRSSPEAVAPINQETSATSATPYCEHHRHVQKLLSPASFRFSRLTFSFASHRRRRVLTLSSTSFSFSNVILFLPFAPRSARSSPRVHTTRELSVVFFSKANIKAYVFGRQFLDVFFLYVINNDFVIAPNNHNSFEHF